MFGCCGLAVVWGLIVAVAIGLDVIGSCGLVVAGTSGLVVTGTSAIVVCGGSVIVDGFVGFCVSEAVGPAVVVMVFVVNVVVDGRCGFDEVADGGCVVDELLAGGSPGPVVATESMVSGAGVVGSARSAQCPC